MPKATSSKPSVQMSAMAKELTSGRMPKDKPLPQRYESGPEAGLPEHSLALSAGHDFFAEGRRGGFHHS